MKKKVQFLTVELFTESSNVCITNEQNKTNISQFFQMHIFGFVRELLDNFFLNLDFATLRSACLSFGCRKIHRRTHKLCTQQSQKKEEFFFLCSGKIRLAHVVAHSQVYIELRMRTFIAPRLLVFVVYLFVCLLFCSFVTISVSFYWIAHEFSLNFPTIRQMIWIWIVSNSSHRMGKNESKSKREE